MEERKVLQRNVVIMFSVPPTHKKFLSSKLRRMLHREGIALGRIDGVWWELKDKGAAQASQMCVEVFFVPTDTQGVSRNSNCQLLQNISNRKKKKKAVEVQL